MADRVVRMKYIGNIEHAVEADRVVLKVNGLVGGKQVRAELSFDYLDLQTVVQEMRKGAKEQLRKWEQAKEVLGSAQ